MNIKCRYRCKYRKWPFSATIQAIYLAVLFTTLSIIVETGLKIIEKIKLDSSAFLISPASSYPPNHSSDNYEWVITPFFYTHPPFISSKLINFARY